MPQPTAPPHRRQLPEDLDNLEALETLEYLERSGNKKTREPTLTIDSLLGGGYLLSHFRSTIGVVRLNFSVRNGKRWDPHAMTTLSLPFSARTAHWLATRL